jgi:protocatechuate 3,4-dioxygenase beta subunit
VPVSIELTILDVAAGGAPVEGAAVYLWHCDREGRYSIYDQQIAGRTTCAGSRLPARTAD